MGNMFVAVSDGRLGIGISARPDDYVTAAVLGRLVQFYRAKPGDLPFEQATVFEFVVNMHTAKALGLKILQSILIQATGVIEWTGACLSATTPTRAAQDLERRYTGPRSSNPHSSIASKPT